MKLNNNKFSRIRNPICNFHYSTYDLTDNLVVTPFLCFLLVSYLLLITRKKTQVMEKG